MKRIFGRLLVVPAGLLSLVASAALVACPAKEPMAPVGISPVTATSGSHTSGDGSDNVFRCKEDAECRSHSFYCGGCSCLALADQEQAPKCVGGNEVQCLIDPCRGKASFCDRGHCNLRDVAQ